MADWFHIQNWIDLRLSIGMDKATVQRHWASEVSAVPEKLKDSLRTWALPLYYHQQMANLFVLQCTSVRKQAASVHQ